MSHPLNKYRNLAKYGNLAKYRNSVSQLDVLKLLRGLPDGCLDMVYGDPDYGVGINYAGKKYITRWEKYIKWYITLAKEAMRVLKPDGNLFMLNYPKQNAYLRVNFLDEAAYSVHDYVWTYNTNVGHSPRRFTTAHRSILHATKSKHNVFYKEQVAEDYLNPTDKRIQARIRNGHSGRMPYSWCYHDLVKNVSKEKTKHACQIPTPLVRRLLLASTKKGDTCCILFGGSGNELLLCRELERHFISCELHPEYHEMIKERLHKSAQIPKQTLSTSPPACKVGLNLPTRTSVRERNLC